MGEHKLYFLKAKQVMRPGWSVRAPLLLGAILLALLLSLASPVRWARAQPPGPAGTLSAWIADWDLTRGMAAWRAHPGLFDSIRVFAAYFNERDQPVLAAPWVALIGKDVRRVFGATPVFLTVVNDLTTPTGKGNKLKDPELVRRLVADPSARTAHAGALVALARQYGFQGIEIDYENITAEVWPQFLLFIEALQQRTRREGLALSVLLQPQARYQGMPLPAGPVYVLMGYNLFGSHSGPGPKATPDFLARQASALAAIGALDATSLALATGGFDWTAPRAATQLDEQAATSLLARTRAVSERSGPDGYVVSRYRDASGVAHEVWHADPQTLATLWQAARGAGFSNLVLWRLGGNSPAFFQWLETLRR